MDSGVLGGLVWKCLLPSFRSNWNNKEFSNGIFLVTFEEVMPCAVYVDSRLPRISKIASLDRICLWECTLLESPEEFLPWIHSTGWHFRHSSKRENKLENTPGLNSGISKNFMSYFALVSGYFYFCSLILRDGYRQALLLTRFLGFGRL